MSDDKKNPAGNVKFNEMEGAATRPGDDQEFAVGEQIRRASCRERV